MTIEIDNRLYNDFVLWAKANNMSDGDMAKYIEKAFRDKFTLDKYGDLNDKIKKPKTEEDKPKRTRTVKKNTVKGEPINEPIEGVSEDVNGDINGDVNEDIKPEKPKRKTKVIVST